MKALSPGKFKYHVFSFFECDFLPVYNDYISRMGKVFISTIYLTYEGFFKFGFNHNRKRR